MKKVTEAQVKEYENQLGQILDRWDLAEHESKVNVEIGMLRYLQHRISRLEDTADSLQHSLNAAQEKLSEVARQDQLP